MSELENKELETQVGWMRREAPYAKMQSHDIQEENRRVLTALKIL
jgi:chromosome segregation ATPase